MKNINIFGTGMFPYLEGEEIKGGTLTLTIRDMKTEELKSHKGAKENKEVLYFSESQKGFVLNKTNAKRIAQMYGAMTGEWEGKQITLTTEEVQAFGESHNALRIVPGAIGQPCQTMNLDELLIMLNKVERIEHFYSSPHDVLRCRPKQDPVPNPDDIDGWRVLFEDARNYAIGEVERMVEEGVISPDEVPKSDPMKFQVPMPEAMVVETASEVEETGSDLEDLYPDIFSEEEDAQDITPDASGVDLPDTDGIANLT